MGGPEELGGVPAELDQAITGKEETQPTTPKPQPKRLIPIHLSQLPEVEAARQESAKEPEELLETLKSDSPTNIKDLVTESTGQGGAREREIVTAREMALGNAPDLEGVLQKWLTDRGREIPPEINLSLVSIREFRRYAKEAQDLRKVIKSNTDPIQNMVAFKQFNDRKRKINDYLELGTSFEKAYREYISAQNQYIHFKSNLERAAEIKKLCYTPAFTSLSDDAGLDEASYARIEALARTFDVGDTFDQAQVEESIESLKMIYAEGTKEFEAAKQVLLQSAGKEMPKTKRDLLLELETCQRDAQEAWQDNPMVRWFYQNAEIDKLMMEFASGQDIIENQSSIAVLNELDRWETQHQNTTIGGVLVGPPGVGKTTLIRHYLKEKDRKMAYIDMSEEVTRYLLFGSKDIVFESPTQYYKKLSSELANLDEESLKDFVTEHHEIISDTLALNKEDATVTLLEILVEDLGKAQESRDMSAEEKSRLSEIQNHLVGLTKKVYLKELATEFSHTVKKNGWRDGVIIAALRNHQSVIIDEFNKCANFSMIYDLLVHQPGTNWNFGDNNNEPIPIPDDWRMYFTANIGQKHAVYDVAEALASRAGEKVMTVGYPTEKEEMMFGLVALSNPAEDFLRSEDDLAKLFVLIHETFPKLRTYIDANPDKKTYPLSYRTLRELAEILVTVKDPVSKQPVYEANKEMSFDQAVFNVLTHSYNFNVDHEVVTYIVDICTTQGLLLDDSVEKQVRPIIGDVEYEKRKATFSENKEDFRAIAKKVRGMSRDVSADAAQPISRNF